MPEPAIHILLVEDNPGDVRLTTLALRAMRIPIQVSTTRDGEEALAFMRQDAPYGSVDPPDLVLLDLNMPKKNGFASLQELKEDERLKDIPVIIYSTSNNDHEKRKCINFGALEYLVKPISVDEGDRMVKRFMQFIKA